ncbi:MAG: hypothetical protein ACRDRG_21105 [Pseudonocardiaceae bacterium]
MKISNIFAMGGGWGYRYAGYSDDYPGDDFNGRQDVCDGNRCGQGGTVGAQRDFDDTRGGLFGFLL